MMFRKEDPVFANTLPPNEKVYLAALLLYGVLTPRLAD